MYVRKTRDCWRFYVDYGYGHGWEHEITEYTKADMQMNRKAYRENCPYPLKIVKGREYISSYGGIRIYCKGFWHPSTPDGPAEFDCGYENSGGFACEECIVNGGYMSPVTGKLFRGNREPYVKLAEQEIIQKHEGKREII